MERLTSDLVAFEAEAEDFAGGLRPHPDRATLVTLSGELGAGKTAFTKALARVFGVSEEVTSPTFVLLKSYDLPRGPFKRLIHIDAYRLERGAELAPLRFDEYLAAPDNLIMFEWPERVRDALPAADVQITITAGDNGTRSIRYA